MDSKSICMGQLSASPGAAVRNSKVQAGFDRWLFALLLFSGLSFEWIWNRQESTIGNLLLYARLILYPLFFCHYFLNRKRLGISLTENASLGTLPVLMFAFFGVCLAERIANNFVDTWFVWKDYYFLALLPLWGLLGFDVGEDIRRVQLLLYRLAVSGALLSYVSFAMQSAGISDESLAGPMFWAFRFIVIFSFFYFLSVVVTGSNRTGKAFFWLAGSSLAVFWGFYKFTIVSTALGVAAWGIFLVVKGGSLGKKAILSFLALVLLSLIGVAAADRLTGGSVLSAVSGIYTDQWMHNVNVDEIAGVDPLFGFNQISGGRYLMWVDVVERIADRPLLGNGLGQRYEEQIVVHNGYLDLLLSFGILGFTVFISGLVIWLRRIAVSNPYNHTLLIQLISVGYISTILVSNLFGSVWIQFPTISFYASFLSGISYRLCAERETEYSELK